MPLWVKLEYHPELGGRFVDTESVVGDNILDLLREAESLARRLECGVQFEFQGHLAWIWPGQDPVTQYERLKTLWGRGNAAHPSEETRWRSGS